MTKTPHVHAELIKAWADGAQIQYSVIYGENEFGEWTDAATPTWSTLSRYRIKPEPKPDHIRYIYIGKSGIDCFHTSGCFAKRTDVETFSPGYTKIGTAKITMDGETGKLKAVELISS